MVKKEYPDTKIIIISGYDDFSYAKEAISIVVEGYLLNPITKDKLSEVMLSVKSKLDAEEEQGDYYQRFRMENQEYERFASVRFFEQLVGGNMSVSEVYDKAKDLSIDLDATCYNLLLLVITSKDNASEKYSKYIARLQEQLMQFLLCCPEFIVFHWSLDTYAIIIKGDESTIESNIENCINNISRRCGVYDEEVNWYLSVGGLVHRFSEFKNSFERANRKLSCRYLIPEQHVFTDEDIDRIEQQGMENESALVDQKLVGFFLESGTIDEIEGFVKNIIPSNSSSLESALFCQYFAMTMYMCVCDYIRKLGKEPDDILRRDIRNQLTTNKGQNLIELVEEMMASAINIRQGESIKQYKGSLAEAMAYVDANYSDQNISLNLVAKEVNISPSYLSAVFSREAEQTFVEYLTQKRMQEALRRLKTTTDKTSTIAEAVGYKDAHYFSYIFKKTFGCSPKEYRENQ